MFTTWRIWKCYKISMDLQKSALMQPRTSPLKFGSASNEFVSNVRYVYSLVRCSSEWFQKVNPTDALLISIKTYSWDHDIDNFFSRRSAHRDLQTKPIEPYVEEIKPHGEETEPWFHIPSVESCCNKTGKEVTTGASKWDEAARLKRLSISWSHASAAHSLRFVFLF